jgi:hypothetical protein
LLNAGQGIADALSVTRILVVALLGIVCLSWLGMAALHVVVLKREGSAWNVYARRWVLLKVIEYGWLLLFIGVAVAGVVPRWGLLLLAAPLVVLWFVRSWIRRRGERSPGWIG